MSKKLFILFGFIIILIICAWLRLDGILSGSFAFTYDVGRDMLAVENIVVNHKITLIGQTTGVGGIFYGPWWYLILIFPFFIFSGNQQGIAFFMSVIGIATIFLSYVVGKKIGGVFLGIFFSAFISFSSLMILSSSQIWNPNLIPFFSVLVLLVLHSLFLDSKYEIYRLRNFLLLGLFLGLIIDMEIVFGVLFLIGICVSLIFIFRKKLTIKRMTIFLLGLLFIFSPRIIFDIRHNFLMTKAFANAFDNGLISSNHSSVFDLFFNKLCSLFDLWSDTLTGQSSIVGFVLIIFILFSLIFFYKKIENTQKKFLQTIIIIIAIFLIGITFFKQAIWPHYLIGLPVFYILLVSIIINVVRIFLKKSWFIIIFSVLLWINLNPMQVLDKINKPLWEGNSAVYRNQVAVIDYIYNDAKGKDFKYIVYTPPIHDFKYKYFFSGYEKNKYGYPPVEKKGKLFYLILEPDYELPTRLKNWLRNREGDGTIQKEEV